MKFNQKIIKILTLTQTQLALLKNNKITQPSFVYFMNTSNLPKNKRDFKSAFFPLKKFALLQGLNIGNKKLQKIQRFILDQIWYTQNSVIKVGKCSNVFKTWSDARRFFNWSPHVIATIVLQPPFDNFRLEQAMQNCFLLLGLHVKNSTSQEFFNKHCLKFVSLFLSLNKIEHVFFTDSRLLKAFLLEQKQKRNLETNNAFARNKQKNLPK